MSVVVVDDVEVAIGVVDVEDIVIAVVAFVAAVLSSSSKSSKSNPDLVFDGPVAAAAAEASTAELCHWRGLYEAVFFPSRFFEA